jgi:hypothetical protein
MADRERGTDRGASVSADVLELLGYADLEDRVRDLEADRAAYRELAQLTLAILGALMTEQNRQREIIARQREELAALRPREQRAA